MDEQSKWWVAADESDPMLPTLTDADILGELDGYDDYRLDTVFMAYVRLRRMVRDQPGGPVLWERFG